MDQAINRFEPIDCLISPLNAFRGAPAEHLTIAIPIKLLKSSAAKSLFCACLAAKNRRRQTARREAPRGRDHRPIEEPAEDERDTR